MSRAKSPRISRSALFAAASLAVGSAGFAPFAQGATEEDFSSLKETVLSLNHVGNDRGSSITKGNPGAVAINYAYWNNISGGPQTISGTTLKDNHGEFLDAGVTLSWTGGASGFGNNNKTNTYGNGEMTNGWWDAYGSTITLSMTGLGDYFTGDYTVYLVPVTGDAPTYFSYGVNGKWYKLTGATSGSGTTVESSGVGDTWVGIQHRRDDADGALRQYMVIENQTGNLTIVLNSETNNPNSELAAFQVKGYTGSDSSFLYWRGGSATWDSAATLWGATDAGGADIAWGTGDAQAAVFDTAGARTVTFATAMAGSGVWVKAGDVTLTASGSGSLALAGKTSIAVESGAKLRVGGDLSLSLSENSSVILEAGSDFYADKNLSIAAPLTGAGTYHVADNTTTTFSGKSVTPTIALAGTGSVFAIDSAGAFTLSAPLSGTGRVKALAGTGLKVTSASVSDVVFSAEAGASIGFDGPSAVKGLGLADGSIYQMLSSTALSVETLTLAGGDVCFDLGAVRGDLQLGQAFTVLSASNVVGSANYSSLASTGIAGTFETSGVNLLFTPDALGFFQRVWDPTKPSGSWTGNSYGDWTSNTVLPDGATSDVYVLKGGTSADSRTITIPDGVVVHLDGSQQAKIGGQDATGARIGDYGLRTGAVLNPAGLYVGGADFNPESGAVGGMLNEPTTAKWTIEGGILHTGDQQADGHWAIWVSRGDYDFNNKDSEANLNIKSTLIGGGNIVLQHAGRDRTGLLIKGDASQYTGAISRKDGNRFIGFTGDVSLGAALIDTDRTLQFKDITGNTVFGATVKGGAITFDVGLHAVALTGGSYSGVYTNEATETTTTTFNFNNGTFAVKGNALGAGTTSLNNSSTLVLFGDGVVTGKVSLNGGSTQINVGLTPTFVYGDVADYGGLIAQEDIAPKSFTLASDPTASVTYAGSFTGTGTLVKTGEGRLALTGTASNYTGGTNIKEGILAISSDSNIGTGTHTINGGTLQLSGDITKAWTIAGSGSRIDVNGVTHSIGALSGSAALEKTGMGTLVLSADSAFMGALTISEGGVSIGNGGTAGSLAGTADVALSGTTLTFDRSYQSGVATPVLARNITGTGDFVKAGSGNLLFTGTTASGVTTTVEGGELRVSNTLSGGVVVKALATIAIASGGGIDSLTLESHAIYRNVANNIATVGNLDVAGILHFDISEIFSSLTLGTHALLNFTAGNVSTAEWRILNGAGYRGSFDIVENANSIALQVNSIGSNLNLVWTGASNNSWEFVTQNWNEHGTVNAQSFVTNDAVRFDATAAADKRTVTLNAVFTPGAMTVDTAGGADYTFDGTGSINGDTLLVTLQGGGTVTMATANAYGLTTGGTLIREGTTVAISQATGLGLGGVTMENGTALNSSANTLANKLVVSDGASVTLGFSGGDSTLSGAIEGAGSINVTGAGRRTFSATASSFDGTLTVADAFTFNGANANWANVDVVSTASTSDRVFSGTGTMKFSSVTVGGTGKLLVNNGTNLDVAKITALENLTFEGGGNLTSSTGKVRFEVEQGKTVTWNNNKFVNSSDATLIKEGAGELRISNFQDGGIAKNIEVLGGTLNATNNSRVDQVRNYLIKGTSPSDVATFIACSGGNVNGYFGNLQMTTGGVVGTTMTMEYGVLRFANGVSNPLPLTVTMRSSTIDFATPNLNADSWQMGALKNLIVERPDDMQGTADVAVSYLKVTGVAQGVQRSGIHIGTDKGNAEFNIKEYAKLVVQAWLIDSTGGTNAQGVNSGRRSDLIKKGAGELELRWANAFSGSTQVQAGTLRLADGSSILNSKIITISDGGRLLIGGTGQIASDATVTVVSGGTIGGVGTLANNLTLGTGTTLEIGSADAGGTIVLAGAFGALGEDTPQELILSGNVNLTGASLLFHLENGGAKLTISNPTTFTTNNEVNITYTGLETGNALLVAGVDRATIATWKLNGTLIGADGVAEMGNGVLQVTAVPEPSTYALLGGAGALALALLRRRKRKS